MTSRGDRRLLVRYRIIQGIPVQVLHANIVTSVITIRCSKYIDETGRHAPETKVYDTTIQQRRSTTFIYSPTYQRRQRAIN